MTMNVNCFFIRPVAKKIIKIDAILYGNDMVMPFSYDREIFEKVIPGILPDYIDVIRQQEQSANSCHTYTSHNVLHLGVIECFMQSCDMPFPQNPGNRRGKNR